MGNLTSCSKPQSSKTSMAKLVDSQGQLKLVNLPITAAELMLENPGFAVSPVEDIRRNHWIPAMKADERLVHRKVYLLVPVDKVNSRLSDLQVAAVETICCDKRTSKRTRGGGSKVSPVLVTGFSGESLGELVKDLGGVSTGWACQRKRLDRVWAPVLEPILEGC